MVVHAALLKRASLTLEGVVVPFPLDYSEGVCFLGTVGCWEEQHDCFVSSNLT